MKLQDLIIAVKEQSLSKDQLEHYQQEMSYLFADMMLEMAELEKLEAINMASKTKEQSVAEVKVFWKGSKEGQRLIVLKRYSLATKTLLNSLKSRLYSIY